MAATPDSIKRQYRRPNLVQKIELALKQVGMSTKRLKSDDLARLDEFHIRGREATEELLE